MSKIISHALESRKVLTNPILQVIEKQLYEFELGRFLLENRGLNGKWTSYIIRETGSQHPLENWLLTRAPGFLATRERFGIFQQQFQEYIQPDHVVASIPCGIMDDLLLIPSLPNSVRLVGVDADEDSLNFVKTRNPKVETHQKDAWDLGMQEVFELITSNGLNIYVKDDARVTELYKSFWTALKPNGILVTSFLSTPEHWNKEAYTEEDMEKQKQLFSNVLQVNWQYWRSEKTTQQQLQDAGFKVLKFIYDKQGLFPTVVAQKLEQPDLVANVE